MYSYKNARLHNEIRKWDTAQLIEALQFNGLGDCCAAVENREIDGDSFLNLTEGQLAFWRNTLNTTQIKRFWSVIQLARERPQDFVVTVPEDKNLAPSRTKTEKIKSPIAESLENLLGHPTNVSPILPPPGISENNNFPQLFPPRPDNLPPKPQNLSETLRSKKLSIPSAPLNDPPEVLRYRSPLPIPESPHYLTPKPPIPIFPVAHEEEEFYEEEPVLNIPKPVNPLFKKPEANPIPVPKREPPLPPNYGRPLPTPPEDESLFPLPPNTVPIVRNTRSPLPRPPNFLLPPAHVPAFENDDQEQPDYDPVSEVNLDEYKSQSWYRNVSRKEALALLRGRPSGTFIARPSTQPQQECSFSVIYDSKFYNLAVIKEGGKFVLGKNYFNTVMEIVDKYTSSPLVLNGPNNEDLFVTLRKM